LIALLLIVWGTQASQSPSAPIPVTQRIPALALGAAGLILALYLFMADELSAVRHHTAPLRDVLPAGFPWPLFCVALLLMSAPVVQGFGPLRRPQRAEPETVQEIAPPIQ
jgi:hypothetical protein